MVVVCFCVCVLWFRSLNVQATSLGTASYDVLALMLRSNHCLQELNMSRNFVSYGDSGLAILAESLKDNKALTKLNCGGNFMHGEDGHAVVTDLLKVNTTLLQIEGLNTVSDVESLVREPTRFALAQAELSLRQADLMRKHSVREQQRLAARTVAVTAIHTQAEAPHPALIALKSAQPVEAELKSSLEELRSSIDSERRRKSEMMAAKFQAEEDERQRRLDSARAEAQRVEAQQQAELKRVADQAEAERNCRIAALQAQRAEEEQARIAHEADARVHARYLAEQEQRRRKEEEQVRLEVGVCVCVGTGGDVWWGCCLVASHLRLHDCLFGC
jgi:hypothetical protein